MWHMGPYDLQIFVSRGFYRHFRKAVFQKGVKSRKSPLALFQKLLLNCAHTHTMQPLIAILTEYYKYKFHFELHIKLYAIIDVV